MPPKTKFWALVMLSVAGGACGGTVSGSKGQQGVVEGTGASSSSNTGGEQSTQVSTGGWRGTPAGFTGGAGVVAGSGNGGWGGGVGGQGGEWRGGGGAANPIPWPSVGGSCGYVFEGRAWPEMCAPDDRCLGLDPSTWTPAVTQPDGGASMPVLEAPFCEQPIAGRIYTFAVDQEVIDGNYAAYDVYTGQAKCEGQHLAYLGYFADTSPVVSGRRTLCFSIDGSFLQSRLAVLRDGNHFSNLRPVSSCPCAHRIPYNTEACPPPNGSAGAPACD